MMTKSTDQDWVLPSAIPFDDLRGRDLEECVYWLLDAMGAKDLEWRTGGRGGGAADGGRDLEAQFFEANSEGELEPKKWWVECKGRAGTVEPDEVKSAANNALAYEGLDRVIIATNTQFSNPTRDWVKEWQRKHPSPKIQLWDRSHLERYLSQHPDVVIRLFSEALSLKGRLKGLEIRFWNRLEFVSKQALIDLWKARASIEVTPASAFALIANEFANGYIGQRPWGVALSKDLVAETLSIGLINVGYLLIRSSRTGTEQRILFRTFAYLLLAVLRNLSAASTTRLVIASLNHSKDDHLPEEIAELLLMPIVEELLYEVRDVCSDDCSRVYTIKRNSSKNKANEAEDYWLRFYPNGDDEPEDDQLILIEKQDASCNVGFEVDSDRGCPLYAFKPSISNVNEFMDIIDRVTRFRSNQAETKREEARQQKASAHGN